ncbi:MAG: DNA mismatch repair protein MutS, partial [Tateyamaria sp.]
DAMEPDIRPTTDEFGISLSTLGGAAFDSTAGADRLGDLFNVSTLDAYGSFSRAEVGAMGALVEYLNITQKGNLPLLRPPRQEAQERTVQIDAATRRNLELTTALSGGRNGSLLSVIDKTVTAAGARLLERRISSPSRVLQTISDRLDGVAYCAEASEFSENLRAALKQVPDLDRALSRLALNRGGPRDLAALRNGLSQARLLSEQPPEDLPHILKNACADLSGHDDLIDRLDNDLVADPPLLARDGGFIAAGCDAELDDARQLRDEGRSVIARLQQDYAAKTGIQSLKIKHNNVLGYFIEATATHADKMMSEQLSETFIHRQTTANQVRFTTVELSDLETRILNAGGRALEIEKRLYEGLKSLVLESAAKISQTARALAELDLSRALADLAVTQSWCKPTLDSSRSFDIEGGRHPVVEHALAQQGGTPFIANDCNLTAASGASVWLLTGPNMSGKSTFLRQNALIAILAQMGSYVPARAAHIGLVSQIFSRVGASDDLARGRSTFMVEMVETAAILNQADVRALVILDEIGRGTATYDGLSIAWATLEHLHDVNKSRALFATHYHEMTALAGKLDGVENATVSVKEWDGEVIFLHEVKRGAADRSYGVQVAQLAGLPPAVIARARVVLEALESGEREGGATQKTLIDDLPLFSAAPAPLPVKTENSPALEMLETVHPDELSPREALELIYKLKDAAKS